MQCAGAAGAAHAAHAARATRRRRSRRARHARAADGRRAFLTTLAAVSLANDEILSTRGTIDRRIGSMLLLLILFFVAYETLFETVRYLSVRSFALVNRIYCSIFVSKIEDIIVDFILVCTIPPLESVIVIDMKRL